MTTYAINDVFLTQAGGTNGAAVTAWKASRFGSAPAKGSQPPSGSPDAGPVTTAATFGQDGGFTLECPTNERYYVTAYWQGVHYWTGPVSPRWTDGSTGELDVGALKIGGVAIPTPPGGTTEYLRADGTWDVPPGGGSTPVTGDVVVVAGSDVNVPWATYTSDGTGHDEVLLETAATAAGGGRVWVIGTLTLGADLVIPSAGLNIVAAGDACPPVGQSVNFAATANIILGAHAIDVSNGTYASGVTFQGGDPAMFKAASAPGSVDLTDCALVPTTAVFSSDAMSFSFDHVSVGTADDTVTLSGQCGVRNCPLGGWSVTFDCTSGPLLFCANTGSPHIIVENAGTDTEVSGNVMTRGPAGVTIDGTCTSTNVCNNSGFTVIDNGTTTNAQGNY